MNKSEIEHIPIAEIRVVNPRTRNKTKFQEIVASIAEVGLKKPITGNVRRGVSPKSSKWAAATELGWQPSSSSGHIVTSCDVKVSLLPPKHPHFSGYIDGQCKIPQTYNPAARQ